jgi:hypothetical protein
MMKPVALGASMTLPLWFGLAAKDMYNGKAEAEAELDSTFAEHLNRYSRSFATPEEYLFRRTIFAERDT